MRRSIPAPRPLAYARSPAGRALRSAAIPAAARIGYRCRLEHHHSDREPA
ncbi:hypothetical protein AvCA_47680 [Azotobacter vinelandii CA]|uniref:Uncharacterized protein n=2 Tax=Azotobacter vinelandii TaxID=354 RepID=C1DJ53_AZOVD|nr:hypothetical protein Avin_47680 [Azotobacter vinelandii DJ]AGK15864.1 hypothetical protein AvCA_47680 [Azotobacter vinelandii CA]AGK22208.1 hypothetical protein AvCA6_47680 [Azotobacter vinelandii CA6]